MTRKVQADFNFLHQTLFNLFLKLALVQKGNRIILVVQPQLLVTQKFGNPRNLILGIFKE
jgi:hypothetical protein